MFPRDRGKQFNFQLGKDLANVFPLQFIIMSQKCADVQSLLSFTVDLPEKYSFITQDCNWTSYVINSDRQVETGWEKGMSSLEFE